MLISDQRQFVFVHIRKAGGTSLRSRLEPFALLPTRNRWTRVALRLGLIRSYQKIPFHPHAPLSHAEKAMPADRFTRYFKFAVIRNPWARLLSEYDYIREFTIHPRYPAVSQMTLDEFIDHQAGREKAHQLPMLADSSGEYGVDQAFRLEDLDQEYRELADRLGLDPRPLPHLNQQEPDRDYRPRYSDQAAERVATAWREEIERFNYSFE